MLKSFFIVGDPHTSDINPGSRIDDYREAILEKLRFVVDSANAAPSCEGVLILGDLFHRKSPNLNSHSLVKNIIHIFNSCTKKIFIIPGNHDISMTATNLDKQPLAVIGESGAATILGYPFTDPHIAETESFSIFGLAYAERNEKPNSYYKVEHSSDKFRILAIHQTLMPNGETFFGDYINFSDLQGANAELVACGHYHQGFTPKVQSDGGLHFCNPGALSRGSISTNNIERDPCFVEISVQGKELISWTAHSVNAEPSDKVFDLVKLEKTKVNKQDFSEFTKNIKELTEGVIDVTSVEGLEEAMLLAGGDKTLVAFTKPYLEKAREELKL